MEKRSALALIQVILYSFIVCWWYIFHLSGFVESGQLAYWSLGVLGCTFFTSAALTYYLSTSTKKWFGVIAILLWLLCTSALTFIKSVNSNLVLIFSIMNVLFQGVALAYFLPRWLKKYKSFRLVNYQMIGMAIALLVILIFGTSHLKLEGKPDDPLFHPFELVSILLILFLVVLEWLVKDKEISVIESGSLQIFHKAIKYAVYVLAMIFVALEILIIYWAMILSNDNQGIKIGLILPLTLVLIFIWRIFSHKIIHRISDIGWMFVLSLILTFSLGMFYTFGISVPFIFGFSFSIAILSMIHRRIFGFVWNKNRIIFLLIICGVVSLIGGLYIQNHIDFIKSIEMPTEVLILSARQAFIKELAFFAGLSVVLSGYLFLKRRSFSIQTEH